MLRVALLDSPWWDTVGLAESLELRDFFEDSKRGAFQPKTLRKHKETRFSRDGRCCFVLGLAFSFCVGYHVKMRRSKCLEV